MKKVIYALIAGVLMASCGAESDEETNLNGEPSNSDELLSEETVEDTAPTKDIIVSTGWQINQYAEYFMGTSIKESADDLNVDEGDIWYYQVLDLKGGYVRLMGAVEGYVDFALWRMKNGKDLVGKTTVSCGPVCSYSYNFYEQNGEEGKEITTDILPLDEMEKFALKQQKIVVDLHRETMDYPEDWQYSFELPREGTAMMVYLVLGADRFQFPLVMLGWDKEKFSITKKFEIPGEITEGEI